MDKDSPRYGSRDDDDSRLFSDEPPERDDSRQSDRGGSYGSRLFDDDRDTSSSDAPGGKRGGLFSSGRERSSLDDLKPSRYDSDPAASDTPSSREGGGFRSGAGFGRGLEREPPSGSSWSGNESKGRNPLLPGDTGERSERRFSWEKDEPADPAPRPEADRDYTAERAGVVSSRLDRLSSGMRQRLSERSYDHDRGAEGAGYADLPPARDYEPARRPAYDPPPRDERAYRAEPPVADSYIPPEQPPQYRDYDDTPYRGAHARELADVDQRYAREYQYDAEDPAGRQAGYREYDEDDYQEFDQPYEEYQPKSRGPFLILGSLIGVAVIGAGLFYIYQQGLGDSREAPIPVVEGDDAPVKVVPD
ncbi:MAG: hypothetical protein ACR2PM_19640, partial [Hyphomicrobiales bacterium]